MRGVANHGPCGAGIDMNGTAIGATCAMILALAVPAAAQPAPQQRPFTPSSAGNPPQRQPVARTAPQQSRERVEHPTAEFAGLDKITGRIIRFDVRIGETVQFGALQVTPRSCAQRLAGTQDHVGFIEVDEITLRNEIRRIFNGWMFAASPGLNAVEHPIYDVWLGECKGGNVPQLAAGPRAGFQGDGEAPALETPPARRAPPRPQRPPQQQRQQAPSQGGIQPGIPFDPNQLQRR